jgi:hypothetical protein
VLLIKFYSFFGAPALVTPGELRYECNSVEKNILNKHVFSANLSIIIADI